MHHATGRHREAGQVTAFVVAGIAAAWLGAGIVVDGGLAMATASRAHDVAQEAARAGAQSLDVDRLRRGHAVRLRDAEAAAAARHYLARSEFQGAVRVNAGPGTVTVTVDHRQRTQVLRLIGLTELTGRTQATAGARPATEAP
ncbi:hypothetical protein E0L36_02295 [Streptomyces sp. AJS327]|nr:hypothetical protein [Streptomyces sp. AJS327]